MRLSFAALVLAVLAGLPAPAVAQTAVPAPRATATLPPIGLPLPRIALPLPPIASSARVPVQPAVRVPPAGEAWRGRANRGHDGQHGNRRRGARPAPRGIYVVPAYGWPDPYSAGAPGAVAAAEVEPRMRTAAPTGTLHLDVPTDPQAQVYVDGRFAGMLAELPSFDLELTEGAHRIELRGAQHQPLAIDVQITAGRTITYRSALTPLAAAAAAPAPQAAQAAPRAPATVYMIPGCYLGNVPPAEAGLPASCDLSRVTTFHP